MKLKIAMTIVSMLFAVSAFAEFRVWNDRDGNALEAELAGTEGKDVILRKRDGMTIVVSPSALSEDDRNYLKGRVPDEWLDSKPNTVEIEKPPVLEIDFKKLTDTNISRYTSSHRDIDVYCSVMITKKNSEPYPGRLKTELYVFGSREIEKCFVLLAKAEQGFSFTDERRETTLHSGRIRLRKYHYNDDYNTEYEGYLAVVLDSKGKVLAMKADGSEFEEHYEQIVKFKKGTYFNKRYEVSYVDSGAEHY